MSSKHACRGAALLLGVILPVAGANAQQLGGGGAPDISLVRVFLALLVCLIVAVLAALLIRQRVKGGGSLPLFTRLGSTSSRIRLIETRRVAPQSDVCLVECDGQEYLLLLSPAGASVLRQGLASERWDESAQ